MGASFLIQEFNKVWFGSSTFVVFRIDRSFGEVFNRWVGFDTLVFSCRFGVFGSSINLGDYYRGLRGEISC